MSKKYERYISPFTNKHTVFGSLGCASITFQKDFDGTWSYDSNCPDYKGSGFKTLKAAKEDLKKY